MSGPDRRRHRLAEGPFVATPADIPQLNALFTEAFTDRYRRDGMTGVRVPPLHPAIWRYAIEDAGDGALFWRGNDGRVAGFNMVHRSGTEGWMGPLCVRPELQGQGLGRDIVEAGMRWLRQQEARVIGLETMPRTLDNIGFYSTLGFIPGYCTLTLTLEAKAGTAVDDRLRRVGLHRLTEQAREQQPHFLAQCRTVTAQVRPGYDFTRELELTERLRLGDTVLLGTPDAPLGFALCHTMPLVEGRAPDELRVLKLVLARRGDWGTMLEALQMVARREGCRRVAVRLQGDYPDAYRTLIAMGARVRWSDLRMSVHGWAELPPTEGMLLSNWEI